MSFRGPIDMLAQWIGMLRDVYRSLDGTDPTYHPQRAEDRLAEVRRFLANSERGAARTETDREGKDPE